MPSSPIKSALVGAGYIAQWHASAIRATRDVELVAVCDVSRSAAETFAANFGLTAFTSLASLMEANVCQAVHIVTPPHTHRELAITCLEAGLHAFVEKPFATTRADCRAIVSAAEHAGRVVAVGHNFLGLPNYTLLKRLVTTGELGRISSAQFNWHFPLEPLRSGPFGLWMLQSPKNLLLELGPHLYAFAVDLFGAPEDFVLAVGKPTIVPGSGKQYQSWRILGRSRHVDLTFNLSLVETVDDRSVVLHGSSGKAELNFGNDTLIVGRTNASDIVIGPFLAEAAISRQHISGGVANAVRQAISLNQSSPYALGFRGSIGAFYEAIQSGRPIDERFSGAAAARVIGAIEETVAHLPGPTTTLHAPSLVNAARPSPTVLVTGGTGFIGRHLTRRLVDEGFSVRVVSRGHGKLFDDIADKVEISNASLKDKDGLRCAMAGIGCVFHLARSTDTTWEACLENEVGGAVRLAEAALKGEVKRFIYSGTIASYDMSLPRQVITEETGFADDMSDRNLYARSKAACEAYLIELWREKGLPLVIARPGIVVGPSGPLQHWGIGRWHGAGAVRIWGSGRNILPFVLLDDVTEGLIKMMATPNIEGQSFNLVGEPMLTARDYFDAIHEKLDARIAVHPSSLTGLYIFDALKSLLKRYALRKPGVTFASLRDWKSRAHLSQFRCDHAKKVLGWKPEVDGATFIHKAIVEANLLGY